MLYCAGPVGAGWKATNNCRSWGTWTSAKYCDSGKKICAIKTRVQKSLGHGGDDTALNNINLYCCENTGENQSYFVKTLVFSFILGSNRLN